MIKTPSPGYSILIRLEIVSKPGMLAKSPQRLVEWEETLVLWILLDLRRTLPSRPHCQCSRYPDGERVVEELRRIKGAHVLQVTDRTFMVHQGGKIEIKNKIPLNSREDLSMAYTPGWQESARPSKKNERGV